jgi:hypothetical protein
LHGTYFDKQRFTSLSLANRPQRRWEMFLPDSEARRQLVHEHQALLAQEARSVRRERQLEPQPGQRRRRRLALRRRLRPA